MRRGAVIVAIGLLLNFIPTFDLAQLRVPGVLQRLGLCTMLAAPIVQYWRWRGQLAWLVGLLLTYTVIQTLVPVPDAQGVLHTGSLRPGEDVGAWLDRALMDGHLWRSSRTWDPEGLLSTLPAVASQLAGVLVGHWLAHRRDPIEKTVWLMVAGLALLWSGQVLGAWSMPINKSLWSPSYVLFTAGWACLLFGVCYWLLDAQPDSGWRARATWFATPLVIFGMNALFLFALSGLIAKMLGFIQLAPNRTLKGWLYAPVLSSGLAPVHASLVFALLFVSGMFLVAWALWRKGWFIKV
jgi:predicted acyltransferase